MEKKIVFAVGGTGGHVFPAKGLLQELQIALPDHTFEIIGGGVHANEYFGQITANKKSIHSSTLPLKKPWLWPKALFKICRGFFQSVRHLKAAPPRFIIGFGSYHSLPVLAAAKYLKVPYVLYESNTIPGKVNRLFSASATWTAISFPSARHILTGASHLTRMPLRISRSGDLVVKEKAREHYKLDFCKETILVFGGSQGAQRLNRAVPELLSHVHGRSFQVLHFVGIDGSVEEIRQLYKKYQIPCCVKPFETEMQYAWSAADALIARAGAATIFEALEFEVPLFLVPYPHAADQHQEHNALFVQNEIKGGCCCLEEHLHRKEAQRQLAHFLEEREQLITNMQIYKTNHRSVDMGSLVLNEIRK